MPNPEEALLHVKVERAWMHWRRDEPRPAIESAREALAVDPTHESASYVLGCALLATDDADGAARVSESLLGAHPHSALGHELAGVLANRVRKDRGRADVHFREAVRLEPDAAWPRLSLAYFLGESRRLEEAITIARQAQKLEPENADVLHTLQVLYRWNDEVEIAEQIGREALALAPDDHLHHLESGLRLLSKGGGNGASMAAGASFRESLRIHPASDAKKDVIAHETVLAHPLFRADLWFPTQRDLLIVALATPLFWFGLGLFLRPFLWVGWISVAVLLVGYGHYGLLRLCRFLVRRRIDRGRL